MMKKMLVVSILVLWGCSACQSTADKAVQSFGAKSTEIRGFACVQKLELQAEQTPAQIFSAVGRLRLRTTIVQIPDSARVPDQAYYSESQSASIWNSNAIDREVDFSFTASGAKSATAIADAFAKVMTHRITPDTPLITPK